MARDEGIAFHYESFPENFDGCIGPCGGRFLLVCNTGRAPRHSPRSRYTFAHELGHYFIPEHRAKILSGHWPVSLCVTETTTSHVEEREADWFAANLLLPERAVRVSFEHRDATALEHVIELSRYFRVSVTACAYRLLGLGVLPTPAVIYRWSRYGDLIGWRISEATADLGLHYRNLVPTLPPSTVSAAAVNAGARGSHLGRAPAMAWFPRLSGYDPRNNALLHEEVMSLWEHGYLTILYGNSGKLP